MIRIDSVRTGRIATLDRPEWDHHEERTWRSAYRKTEAAGRVRVERLGLEGDQQADTEVHGGEHMALLAYGAAHYAKWRAELGIADFGSGAFAENLTIDGLDESSVCIGDTWATDAGVVVEVSQPRGPCNNISLFWNRPDLLKRVQQTGRTGWYLRVREPGTIGVGDTMTLRTRRFPELTIRHVLDVRSNPAADAAQLAALAACEALSPPWRAMFAERAARLRG